MNSRSRWVDHYLPTGFLLGEGRRIADVNFLLTIFNEPLHDLPGITRDSEINCNECLHHVAEFAEHELTGKTMPEALEAVRHHLTLCIECKEEYDELLNVLCSMEPSA